MPVVGWLSAISERTAAAHQDQFRRGLGENGFVLGRNVSIEYRWSDGQYDRLPAMAAELVSRPVDLILAQGPPAALAAKATTSTIPIVFVVGIDPVSRGLVASYSRPGGNATGATLIMASLGQKRIELLREMVPKASIVAMLVNPDGPDAEPEVREVQAAARANSLHLQLVNATSPAEIDQGFAAIAAQRPDALLIGGDPFFLVERRKIINQVTQIGLVAVYPIRDFTDAGGLISYGTNIPNSFRQAGVYAGRILNGAKPADLPVVQPTTFELVINLRTAKAMNLEVPPLLHARSDDVIE